MDAARKHSRSIHLAISRHLLLTGTPPEQRISTAGCLGTLAEKKLNGFSSKAAERSATPQVSFSDFPRLKAAYGGYAGAAAIYKEVLGQLKPRSAQAAEVRRLLIGAHKSCIETIYLALDALERAPGKKSSLPYMPWELRACESIREISEMGGPASLKEIPELRD